MTVIHTERQTCSSLNNTSKTSFFSFWIIWPLICRLYHAHVRKITAFLYCKWWKAGQGWERGYAISTTGQGSTNRRDVFSNQNVVQLQFAGTWYLQSISKVWSQWQNGIHRVKIEFLAQDHQTKNKSDISYLKTSRAFNVPIHLRALLEATLCWLATL